MRKYKPDNWAIIKLREKPGEPALYKVAAGWAGSYTSGRSWKISSGITKVVEKDNLYEIENHSGSIYICIKNRQNLDWYTSAIVDSFKSEVSVNGGSIQILTTEEYFLDIQNEC